jgi:endonuclease/exonuclease/phosphatase family metal-dependent hydrolase
MLNKRAVLSEFQKTLSFDHVYTKGRLGDAEIGRATAETLRIVSWNIGRGYKLDRIAAALATISPDVACLQEVDWSNRRTNNRDVLEDLVSETGMLGLYGIEFLELCSPWRSKNLAGGGAIGNALLSRLAPVTAFRIELPLCLDWQSDPTDHRALPWVTRWHLRREKRIGRRFAVGAEFAWNGRRLFVCSAHFEDKLGGVRGRWSQFKAVTQDLETRCSDAAIRVIAGDFNTFDSRTARLVTLDNEATALGRPAGIAEAAWWQHALLPTAGYTDPFAPTAWTFRVLPFFGAKLDWIAVQGGCAGACGVGPFASSDHRPVWLDLQAGRPSASEGR